MVVDSGAAENVMPRSMFSEMGIRQTERSKNGKGSKDREERTWQVADVRRPLVSASHIIQAGNDLFIGKDEAYNVTRKKKETSMLRKEGNVRVLELFVEVPPSVTAPVTYTPINQVANGREGSESRSAATAQLFDGRSSKRGRQVQAS